MHTSTTWKLGFENVMYIDTRSQKARGYFLYAILYTALSFLFVVLAYKHIYNGLEALVWGD